MIKNTDWAGVWIDHRKAFIVLPRDEGCEVLKVLSGMEPHFKSTGGKGKSRPFMHESGPSSASHRERSDENTMHKYLSNVVRHLGDATRIFLIGPGVAKDALRNLLVHGQEEHHMLEITLEAAAHMTEPQLKARVMSHFDHPANRYSRGGSPGDAPHELHL